MTFDEIVDFIRSRMTMSHIYQPLLIRSLVDAGGIAMVRQLAYEFLAQDESQVQYYERRIKEMPLRVLAKHGVVERQGELVSLTVSKLTYQQKAQIRMLCEQKLQEFVQKRGLGIWDYRFLETDPIPDSLRYLTLKASGGRCALCAATKEESPLDVDHIIPRSRGGKNELANLQVLCSKCNRSKRNMDDTDFREPIPPDSDPSCPFCGEEVRNRIVAENGTVFAIEDRYPVTHGHLLVIPKRHTTDYLSMTVQERNESDELLRFLSTSIRLSDPEVSGFNVGANCGEVEGQTIRHAHVHIIPRRFGDTEDPKGGIRGAIPTKRQY